MDICATFLFVFLIFFVVFLHILFKIFDNVSYIKIFIIIHYARNLLEWQLGDKL